VYSANEKLIENNFKGSFRGLIQTPTRIFPAGTVEKDGERVRKSYIPVHIQNEYSHSTSLKQQTAVGQLKPF
jgi:hypothetical protein